MKVIGENSHCGCPKMEYASSSVNGGSIQETAHFPGCKHWITQEQQLIQRTLDRPECADDVPVPGVTLRGNVDPWQHRSRGMKCGTCMWWVEKKSATNTDSERGSLGRCRRHAPELGGFPATFATDWCGDHKLDENKV